jgi:hypothetical protein
MACGSKKKWQIKYFELNWDKKQKLWDIAIAILTRSFLALFVSIKKEEKFKINNPIFYIKKLGKEKKIRLKANRRKKK